MDDGIVVCDVVGRPDSQMLRPTQLPVDDYLGSVRIDHFFRELAQGVELG